jgi:mannose-1-phosphate guanylyltransferase/phosphomannomutase
MVKQAVVIAGGLGSRLAKNGIVTPKPLLKVEGRSLIEWQILNLEREGINEILLLLGLHSARIINHVNCIKKNFSVSIRCIVEEVSLGTGGALLNVKELLDEMFVVLYGDLLVDCNLSRLFSDAESSEYGSIGIRPSDHPLDSDLVQTNHINEILKIHPKPNSLDSHRMNLAMTGLMCLKKNLLAESVNSLELLKFDLEKNLISPTINSKGGFKATRLTGFIKDLGTVDRLGNAEELWISRSMTNKSQKAVILDRDGVINTFSGDVTNLRQFRVVEDLVQSIGILRNHNFKIFVATNQPGIAKGFLNWDQLSSLHGSVDMILSSNGLLLDGWYICPHHPEKGFPGEILELKVDCKCRKPKDGLIKQINEDFPLDLERSWFVGDQLSDFHLANSVGLSFVQIGKAFNSPNVISKFDKLEQACRYIANQDKLKR